MNIDLKQYSKAKYAPTLFLMEAIQEAKKEIFEMLAEKVLKEMATWGENYQGEMQKVISDFKKTIAKGDKGDPPNREELENLILTLTPFFKGDPPTREELLALIIPLIPEKPIAGVDFDLPKDGKTPTEAELKPLIKSMIPPPIPGSPDKPEQIARKLNTLEAVVEPKVIKGWESLKQKIAKLSTTIKKRDGGGSGGGGDSVRYIDLSAQLDGATKTFTIAGASRVLAVLGSQAPIGYRPAVDWTFSDTTKILTLTDTVTAPDSGQNLFALYVRG